MKAKTPAERKALERQRRKEAGQVLIQEWVSKENADSVKKYIARIKGAKG